MALPTITTSDFVGWIKITSNEFKSEELEEYINLFRSEYLRKIVGDSAFIKIVNESNKKWTDLVNGVEYINTNGDYAIHNGFLESLKLFIYFEYVRDDFEQSIAGLVRGTFENAERANGLVVANIARSRYNQAVRLVNETTQEFLNANQEYSELITNSTEQASNVYTLELSNTKYLAIDDKIIIDNINYNVVAVVEDASIDIQASESGLDFTNKTATWKPYECVNIYELEYCGI